MMIPRLERSFTGTVAHHAGRGDPVGGPGSLDVRKAGTLPGARLPHAEVTGYRGVAVGFGVSVGLGVAVGSVDAERTRTSWVTSADSTPFVPRAFAWKVTSPSSVVLTSQLRLHGFESWQLLVWVSRRSLSLVEASPPHAVDATVAARLESHRKLCPLSTRSSLRRSVTAGAAGAGVAAAAAPPPALPPVSEPPAGAGTAATPSRGTAQYSRVPAGRGVH